MLSPLTMIVSWLCNIRRRQQTQRPDLVSHEEEVGVARNFDGTSPEAAGGSLADQFLNSSSVSWWILFQYDISGGSNMWYIFAQCLPPLKQDIWIRSRCQDENVLLTETFAFTQQTKHMPPFLILYLTVWYLLLHSINGSWSNPVTITVILFDSGESEDQSDLGWSIEMFADKVEDGSGRQPADQNCSFSHQMLPQCHPQVRSATRINVTSFWNSAILY